MRCCCRWPNQATLQLHCCWLLIKRMRWLASFLTMLMHGSNLSIKNCPLLRLRLIKKGSMSLHWPCRWSSKLCIGKAWVDWKVSLLLFRIRLLVLIVTRLALEVLTPMFHHCSRFMILRKCKLIVDLAGCCGDSSRLMTNILSGPRDLRLGIILSTR